MKIYDLRPASRDRDTLDIIAQGDANRNDATALITGLSVNYNYRSAQRRRTEIAFFKSKIQLRTY